MVLIGPIFALFDPAAPGSIGQTASESDSLKSRLIPVGVEISTTGLLAAAAENPKLSVVEHADRSPHSRHITRSDRPVRGLHLARQLAACSRAAGLGLGAGRGSIHQPAEYQRLRLSDRRPAPVPGSGRQSAAQ